MLRYGLGYMRWVSRAFGKVDCVVPCKLGLKLGTAYFKLYEKEKSHVGTYFVVDNVK